MKKLGRMVFLSAVGACFILAIGSTAFAAANDSTDGNISVEVRYFKPDLTFRAQSNSIQYNGGPVDFKNDLGLGDRSVPEYRMMIGNNIRLDYMKFDHTGSNILNQSLTYEGTSYQINANIASRLRLNMQGQRISCLLPNRDKWKPIG